MEGNPRPSSEQGMHTYHHSSSDSEAEVSGEEGGRDHNHYLSLDYRLTSLTSVSWPTN